MGLFNVWDTEFHLNFLTGIKNAEVGKVKLYGEVLGEILLKNIRYILLNHRQCSFSCRILFTGSYIKSRNNCIKYIKVNIKIKIRINCNRK